VAAVAELWSFGVNQVMRYAIGFLILAIVAGIVLPYFLQDRLVSMGVTLPTWRGSSSPAADHQISGDAVMRFLRVLGVCFALVAVFCFASSRRASRPEASPPPAIHEK
jgi:hypothetical protein